jgi:predicted nucleotidyltransferase
MGLGLPRDFKELLESLNENGVRYLLVGAYAVGNYGYSRFTNDIDIFIAGDRENAERIVKALLAFGFETKDLDPEIFTRKDSLVVMGVEPYAVDILNFISGVEFEAAYANRVMVNDDDLQIPVISLEDLIANKLASGRQKDLGDVEELRKRNDQSSSNSQ